MNVRNGPLHHKTLSYQLCVPQIKVMKNDFEETTVKLLLQSNLAPGHYQLQIEEPLWCSIILCFLFGIYPPAPTQAFSNSVIKSFIMTVCQVCVIEKLWWTYVLYGNTMRQSCIIETDSSSCQLLLDNVGCSTELQLSSEKENKTNQSTCWRSLLFIYPFSGRSKSPLVY